MTPRRFLPVVALALSVACTDGGPVSGPGTMTATLISPHGAEGAALIILIGDEVGDVTPLGGTELHRNDREGTTRLVLVNQAGGLLSFQVAVADTTQPPGVFVQEVAGPDDQLRGDTSAYRLEFAR